MKIQWLGHSSFRIVGSKTVVTDPYGGIGLAFPEVRADIVTVSHGHFDHNAVESVGGEPAVVDDAGMHKIADVTIKGYNTAHDDVQGAKRGGNIIYLITMDGYTIAHLGDLGCMPDHSVLGALEGVDELLIPVGGTYTLDAAGACETVGLLKPRIVVPMHYQTSALAFPLDPVEPFLTGLSGWTIHRLQQSECTITRETLGTPRVLVFNYQK